MVIPANHRQAERKLVALVRSGEWEIDPDGAIWRIAARCGNRWAPGSFKLNRCARRRVEMPMPNGYLMVRAMLDGARVRGAAHRLVWQHFHGDIPDGLVLNHKNGRKADNRPENLEVVTNSENCRHALETGLYRHPVKVPDDQVTEMRRMYADGEMTLAEVGAHFGVCATHVSRIVRGLQRSAATSPTGQVAQ